MAITQAKDLGLLGDDILHSGFDFNIDIAKGAGEFICGESTAAILSIEGKRGFPKPQPRPNTSVVGLWGKPTVLNNVETLATVPTIIENGADWFRGIGTEGNAGTKIFALSGNVKNTGLAEVPLGTSLRELIFDIGGGVRNNKALKAIQTGGPTGGCIPERLCDLPIGYESLAQAGSIMGSGAMLIMEEGTCMVNMARHFLEFAKRETCGQCTVCKLGTRQMFHILDDITEGRGQNGDIELLLELAETLERGSICGLGRTVANPVITTIRYFRDEYEEHIHQKHCRTLMCRGVISYYIRDNRCIACGLCKKVCPVDAVTGAKKQPHEINQDKCVKCGSCIKVCPPKFSAIVCWSGTEHEI
jgi:NADH:ubiquinone oxidoreductase subunit F (NADH-binding)